VGCSLATSNARARGSLGVPATPTNRYTLHFCERLLFESAFQHFADKTVKCSKEIHFHQLNSTQILLASIEHLKEFGNWHIVLRLHVEKMQKKKVYNSLTKYSIHSIQPPYIWMFTPTTLSMLHSG
jgi:hypothetical protein